MTKQVTQILLPVLILLGVFFRLDNIANSQLFYYDEGHYLTIHRAFDETLSANPPRNFFEFLTIMKHNLFLSLKTGKGLWFFLSHLRGFWGQYEMLYFPKILASVFGILTIGLVYLFARRYYESKEVAFWAAVLLAVLPSHVYYSRLGLQETLSALCLLGGFYFYLFSKRLGARTFIASVFFALAYFSNYRLFIIPGLVGFVELFQFISRQEKLQVRKYIWCMTGFAAVVIAFGLLNDGGHLHIIFFWMLRQSEQARGHFHWMNFFSYPYTIFKLEGIIFGLLFFAGAGLAIKNKWKFFMPLALVLFYMVIFSFAHEKGTRYLVVMMPFMAMTVAYSLVEFTRFNNTKVYRAGAFSVVLLMLLTQTLSANQIRTFKSDYLTAIEDIRAQEPSAKVLSTQPFVQNLYMSNRDDVLEMPHMFRPVVVYYLQGYQFMVIGPQAYVSYTYGGDRFEPQLEDHLNFVRSYIKPVKEYDHFSKAMMERFVLEHTVNLKQSIEFLKANKNGEFNRLRVYRSADYVNEVFRRLEANKALRSGGGHG